MCAPEFTFLSSLLVLVILIVPHEDILYPDEFFWRVHFPCSLPRCNEGTLGVPREQPDMLDFSLSFFVLFVCLFVLVFY